MSSETSTESHREADAGLHPRHIFLLLSMIGATAAVVVVGKGHPLALVLLSLTVVAAGLVGLAFTGALAGFFGVDHSERPGLGIRAAEVLQREKMLALRAIKELEFDKAMGKVSDADFAQLNTALRARAVALMEELDRAGQQPEAPRGSAPVAARTCAQCETVNDRDARFCKSCGGKL